MKTSELKRILREDCVEVFTESENFIYGVDWTAWKKEQRLGVRGVIPLDVLTVLGKYQNTPISEREDEKMYEIQNTCSYRYDWGEERLSLYLVKESELYVYRNGKRQYFTQSEIDNFPKEIKGAIECGFLRKVEVE